MASSLKKSPCCKLVLLGDSGVGKTCIISRYTSGTYNQNTIPQVEVDL